MAQILSWLIDVISTTTDGFMFTAFIIVGWVLNYTEYLVK